MSANATDLKEVCDLLRADIDDTANGVLALKNHSAVREHSTYGSNRQNEMIANLTLAYRHLEDARMRIGKVIQHYEGGVSKYDTRPQTPEPSPHP